MNYLNNLIIEFFNSFENFWLILFIISISSIVLYLYNSFAFMAIAKKAKLKNPGLAWIPGWGLIIIAFQISQYHWWPWLLLAGVTESSLIAITMLAFMVFVVIWYWKMFEKINRPGWWALLFLIPIVNLIIIGIAAWGSSQASNKAVEISQ